MTLGQAIVSESWAELAVLAEHYFGVRVKPKDLGKVCKKYRLESWDKTAIYPRLEDRREELLPWLKNRLKEIGAFAVEHPSASPKVITARLHIFFLFLDESPEMLERLRKNDEEIEEQVARSKMFSTPLVPHPVDRVAQRVSHLT